LRLLYVPPGLTFNILRGAHIGLCVYGSHSR